MMRGGQDVPADLGGMHLHVDWTKLQILQWVCEQLNLSKPSDCLKQDTSHRQAPDEILRHEHLH
eukprot:4485038-Amphidinium_carterae.1